MLIYGRRTTFGVVGPPTEKRTGRSDIIPMAIISWGRGEGRGSVREGTDRNINKTYQ
jgi:hypothetical protein